MKKEQVDNMSVQEACDFSVQQIVKQGDRCMSELNCSAYKNEKGQHCAIGHLLDDDDEELMSFQGNLRCLLEEDALVDRVPKLIRDNQRTFGFLQRFHDMKNPIYVEACRKSLEKYDRIDTSGELWDQWMAIVEATV